ncbi:hypothetical protein K438DRAFT_1763002 [Mycena galopus ATCC 62051]|nr:hypothetical protein K438DRAFT_1763002 [Mycena galopus ATCC 62051]
MPLQPTIGQARLDNIRKCLISTVDTVEILSRSFATPFLSVISITTRSLVNSVETVKKNKTDCTNLMEKIHELLYAIISLHIRSDTSGELTPNLLDHLGKFAKTLHKIHTFVEIQQDASRIKQFFRQGEIYVRATGLLSDAAAMEQYAQKTHQEVLELIESLSDASFSDNASSINNLIYDSQNSSSSLSMLPSQPKIFHGRESELSDILKNFVQESPRIAILGAGGMGKTNLAAAVLHHPEITARYEQSRFFVVCDSTSTSAELAAVTGSHLGLKPGKDLMRSVVNHFSKSLPCLLILDNLETVWEPTESRSDVEELLSLLTDISHLALIITMRGAERPNQVRWSHPFLPLLRPLPQDAARQTFIDIADDNYDTEDIDKILVLVDNAPLAINLIAHLVDYEGLSSVFTRWETESTSLLSEGHDKRSNLDLSIALSLSSPRAMASPQSKDLLSLFALLPDGLAEVDLLQSNLPIVDNLHCKTALLRTCLVYTDHKRIKTLVSIRDYMQKYHPPMNHLSRIISNLGNIQNLLLNNLKPDHPDLLHAIRCIIGLNSVCLRSGRGQSPLMTRIPGVFPQPCDPALEVSFIAQVFNSWRQHPISNPGDLINRAKDRINQFHDPGLKCKLPMSVHPPESHIAFSGNFYNILGEYYLYHDSDITTAMSVYENSLSLGTSNGNIQADTLSHLGRIKWQVGDFTAGQAHAHEARELARKSGNLYGEAKALHIESCCWYALGNYKVAISLWNWASNLLGLCGMADSDMDHSIKGTQADVYFSKSEYLEAYNVRSQLLRKVPIEQDPYQHSIMLLNIALIDVAIGTPKLYVQRDMDIAETVFTTVGFSRGVTLCDSVLADLELREENFSAANSYFEDCVRSSGGQDVELVTYCLERLADTNRWSNMDHIASVRSSRTTIFLAHVLKFKQKLESYKAIQFLGDVFLAQDDRNTATNLFTVALEGFTQMDVYRSRAECMLQLGDICMANGDVLRAKELWQTSGLLFERSSQAKKVANIDERLAKLMLSNTPTSVVRGREVPRHR